MNPFNRIFNYFRKSPEPTRAAVVTPTLSDPDDTGLRGLGAVINPSWKLDKHLEEAAQTLVEAYPGLQPHINRVLKRANGPSKRDFSPDQHRIITNRARALAAMNPYCSRAIEIRTNLIVSEGLFPKATCENLEHRKLLQKVLEEYWTLNEWDDMMPSRVKDLSITGECFREIPEISKTLSDGSKYQMSKFKANTLLPEDVISISQDWDDCNTLVDVEFTRSWRNELTVQPEVLPIVYEDLWENPESLDRMKGRIFLLSLRPVGATRGVSDILPVLEWMDVSDQLLYNEAERSAQMLKFMFDISIDNASPQQIQQREQDLRANPPQKGSSIIHPSSEKWSVVQPDLQGTESDVMTNRLFLVNWGGMGLPEHWYAQANTVNKSSGEEMSIPVWSAIRTRKQKLITSLKQELKYAIQIAKKSGKLPKKCQTDFVIQSRDPDRTAYDLVAKALKDISSALQMAIEAQLVSPETGSTLFVNLANSLGLDLPEEAINHVGIDARKAMDVNKSNSPAKDSLLKKTKDQPQDQTNEGKKNV